MSRYHLMMLTALWQQVAAGKLALFRFVTK
jgi:hypothetical protein